jgi:site-specific recombinase XerD
LKEAITQFEKYIKTRYPDSSTAKHYVHDLRLFSQLVEKLPRTVEREDIDRFVEDQLERGLAATTINRRLVAVREFFEYLASENPAEEWPNPVDWKRHKVKEGKPLPRDASEADIERLFAQINHPRDKAMFRLMLDVGLRVDEVAKLRVGDLIEISHGSARRLRVRGKGSKERFVWLMPETLKVVEEYLAQRPSVSDEAMFITRRREGFSVRGIQERLAHYCRLAGVQVSPHQLRHSFGRRMAEAEMPVTSLAALMGHAQLRTTQIYIAGAGVEVQADFQAAIERLEAARQETPPAWGNESEERINSGETVDVWTLAGAEPQPETRQKEFEALDLSSYWEGLPGWLTSLMEEYITYKQRRWKPSQVRRYTGDKLSYLRQFWCWLLKQELLDSLADLKREHVQGFVEFKLQAGMKSSSLNRELDELRTFLRYCQEHGQQVRPSVFRVKRLKQGEALPRFLSETDYERLEQHVLQATQARERDDWLNRTWFYLLSEGGLRVSEVCDLKLGNIDLVGQKLTVRDSKGRDRTVPLSPNVTIALKAYLPLRGKAQSDHVLIYLGQAVKYSLIRHRLSRYGLQAQVKVSPHRLRHTLATRLLNEGMPITSIQRLLGHEKLNTTLIYSRVHNETVQRDFEHAYARMSPAPLLADEFFNAPTEVAEPQPVTTEVNCV